jgi:hypothetical protein
MSLTDDFPDQFVGLVMEVRDMAAAPPRRAFPCKDCGVDTMPPRGKAEWYVVHDEVWQAAGMQDDLGKQAGFLCIGCLETRIGRILTPADFIDAPINDLNDGRSSGRLISRLGGVSNLE